MPKNAQLWSLQVNLTCDVLGERPVDVCGPSLSQNRLTRWSSYKRPPLDVFLIQIDQRHLMTCGVFTVCSQKAVLNSISQMML